LEAPNQIPHPRYNPETKDLDVVVIILSRAMAMNDITPVTLNEDSSVPADDALVDITGWGATTSNGLNFSRVLLFTTLEYIHSRSPETCCVLLKIIRVPATVILVSVLVFSATIQTKLEEENLLLLCNSMQVAL
jgi:hypothetical protein